MKKVLASLVAGLFLVSMTSTVSAASVAGLDWLHFSDTLGESWNTVYPTLQPGGSREEWRYATRTEIESLYTVVHPQWIGDIYGSGQWYPENEGIVDAVGAVVGYTTRNTSTGFRMIDGIALPVRGGSSVSNYRLIDSAPYTPPIMGYAGVGEAISTSSTTAYGRPVASYLVKASLPGDCNGDGKVDGTDLALWQQHYDSLGLNGENNVWAWGNWNDDNKIDGADLALWQQNYDPLGPGGAGLAPVPEPGTLMLIGTGALGIIGWIRRSRIR